MKGKIKVIIILLMFVCLSNVFATRMPYNPGYNPNNVVSTDITTKANEYAGTFVYIVQVASIVTMVFMGLRYMFASADAKADIKKGVIGWCVGAFIVFSGTTLIGIVLEVVTDNNYVNITPTLPSQGNPGGNGGAGECRNNT